MTEFGWTERQLMEEFTVETLERMGFFLKMRAKAEEARSRSASSASQMPKARRP